MARPEARLVGPRSPPPTGFFREFLVGWDGARAGTLDVKHGGIAPITNLARTFAVASVASIRTIDRLRAASSSARWMPTWPLGSKEAFRLLWRIGLRHQVRQLRAGEPADDLADARLLGPLTRRSLREAFKLIVAGQRGLSTTYGLPPPMIPIPGALGVWEADRGDRPRTHRSISRRRASTSRTTSSRSAWYR